MLAVEDGAVVVPVDVGTESPESRPCISEAIGRLNGEGGCKTGSIQVADMIVQNDRGVRRWRMSAQSQR